MLHPLFQQLTSHLGQTPTLCQVTINFGDQCPRGLRDDELEQSILRALEAAGFHPGSIAISKV